MLLIIRILEFLHYFCNKVLLGICILHHTYQGYKVALMTRQNYARVQNCQNILFVNPPMILFCFNGRYGS